MNRCQFSKWLLSIVFFILTNGSFVQGQKQVTVFAGNPLAAISPGMWGIFFEDINFAADGGMYAELVKNKSFEFYNPLMGWKELRSKNSTSKLLIINTGNKNPSNPRYANITLSDNEAGYGLSNEGFRGIGIQKGKDYIFSVLAKKEIGNTRIRIELVGAEGIKLGEAVLVMFPVPAIPAPLIPSDQWQKYSCSISAVGTNAKAHLDIYFEGTGSIDVDMISLVPKDTWMNRSNGLRPDLVQMIADLKPGFLRFPGGCIVEGHELDTRYQWKKTIGATGDRPLIINRWNTEMKSRQAPDYYQSYGLGFYEYFQLSEDLGASPLPILNCGMACQYNTGEVVPVSQLDPYIQDALDLVEFANGPVTSKWGKIRSEMGHPSSFNLNMIGIGNEQWDEQYIVRYKLFEKALKYKYPSIKLVAAAGPAPEGSRFEYAWAEFKKLQPAYLDEHFYKSPQWFLENAGRYDHYSRNGPKVFAGEYAAHGLEGKEAESKNTWMSALAEAAFMTGLERNSEVVQMASYAPLFAHVDAWQWRPDLIWFDNLRCVGTPNYYVQKLFSTNKGTNVVDAFSDGKPVEGTDSMYASAVIDKAAGEVILKVVNTSVKPVTLQVLMNGVIPSKKQGTMQILTANDRGAYNTLSEQKLVYPIEQVIEINKNKIDIVLSAMSLNVIRVAYVQ